MRKQIIPYSLFTFTFRRKQHSLSLCYIIGTSSHNLVALIQTACHDKVLAVASVFCSHFDCRCRAVGLNLKDLCLVLQTYHGILRNYDNRLLCANPSQNSLHLSG